MRFQSSLTVTRRVAVAACLLAVAAAASARDAADDLQRAEGLREDVRRMISYARDQVFPALVNIEVETVSYYGGQERKGGSTGSGSIISQEGYVVTNFHVTDDGRKYRCRLADRREIGARLVGEDPLTDLAILQLNLDELEPDEKLPVAQFGDSSQLQVGDYVMAMGSPLALARSVTLGIVSNSERVFASGDETPEDFDLGGGQRTGLFTRWIQHDAQIHPGNSGGPLVNLKGEIIGVNELKFADGQGFAIPSNLAKEVAHELITNGKVRRSQIGVSLRSIKSTGLERGAIINSVMADSPAAKAGLQAGDVLLSLDGDAVTVRFAEELPPLLHRVASLPVGTELTVGYSREGAEHQTVVKTELLKDDVGDENVFRGWGITAREITERMAVEMRLDSTLGVLVSGVRSSDPADRAEPKLNWGDVIVAVDGQKVETLDQFIEIYRGIMDSEPLPEYVLVEFDRGGKNHVTLIEPKPEVQEDPIRELPKAWIGVATQPVVEELAERLGLGDATGYRITRVYPHTNAAATELQVGDVIVELNDEAIALRGMQDAGLFSRRVRELDIGDDASLTVLRNGERVAVTVELERTQISRQEAKRDRNRDFEMTVREITFFDRDDERWDEGVEGVIVESVDGGGWASRAGLRSGDLIQRIDDHAITDRDGFRATMKSIAEARPERVAFLVLRGARTNFLFVEPEWSPLTEEEEKQAEAESE